MICHLKGTIESTGKDHAVIDVNGVGYLTLMPQRDIDEHLAPGLHACLHTHQVFRQDGGMEIFGFTTIQGRELFKLLLKVKGVGPRLALSVLSSLDGNELAYAIMGGHKERLQAIHGVGKKTAELIIVQLKEKEELAQYLTADAESPSGGDSLSHEVVSLLESFGCTGQEARKAVRKALKESSRDTSAQDLLTICLQILGKSA